MKKNLFLINKKLSITVLLLLMLGGGVFYYWTQKNSQDESYRELRVEKGDLGVTVLATGTVLPQNRLEIKAPVPGRMERVLVKEGQKLHKGQVIAWMSSSERAAMLDAARAKGEEEYQRWSDLYLATPIVAPITGMLILRSVEPGQTFTSSDAIFTMSDRLTVKAQVDETDISKIRNQEPAEIILDAYPQQKIPAVVDQIAYDAKTVNSVTTYIVDVLPKETPDYMRSGMTANVTFLIESRKQILLVSNEAIKVQDGKTIVSLNQSGGKPSIQEVQLGISDGKMTEVLSGLREGDIVLVKDVKFGADRQKANNPFSPLGRARAPRR